MVICTHSPNPEILRRALEAIVPQLKSENGSELLIVDNASPIPVALLPSVAASGARVAIEPRLGLTAARECAAREAKGDVIVFVDDDNILDPDYVHVAMALVADEHLAVISGRVEPEYLEEPPSWLRAHEGALAIRRPDGDDLHLVSGFQYSLDFPIGAGMIVRRELLRDYFASAATGGRIEGRRGEELLAGEDTDLSLFAINRRLRVGSCGRLRLLHVIPPGRMSPAYVMRLNRGALKSAALVNRKWREVFGADVFVFLSQPAWRVAARAVLYSCLAVSTAYRVRAAAQWDLLRLRSLVPWT